MVLDEDGRPLVAVLVCQGESEAQVAASYLRACGLSVRLNSALPKSVLPVEVNGLGQTEVLVREGDVEEARGYLAEADSDG
jgi:hypothetical protein